jgi:hypothetical protein
LPHNGVVTVDVMRYAMKTHVSWSKPLRSAAIVGAAVASTVPSIDAII